MWESLKSFYELQGEIEIANATAQLSTIIMGEVEDLVVYVRRLQDLHSLLDRLGKAVSPNKQAINLLNSLNTRYFGMIHIIQTWEQTAPHLYNFHNILSWLQQKEVRTQITARKRGETIATVSHDGVKPNSTHNTQLLTHSHSHGHLAKTHLTKYSLKKIVKTTP